MWTLINPIVQLVVYFVVMGQILGAARGIDDFAIYIFSGLTIYGLLSEALTGTTSSIIANAGLVKKVYVPREVFPLASMGSALFTFSVQVVVLIAACFILGAPPITSGLIYFPPAVALIVLYGAALGILFSALNVYLRDVQYLVQILLTLSMWAAPIVYGWSMVQDVFASFGLPNWLLEVYTNNPLTLAVLGFHQGLLDRRDGRRLSSRPRPADAHRVRDRTCRSMALPARVRSPAGQLRAGALNMSTLDRGLDDVEARGRGGGHTSPSHSSSGRTTRSRSGS